MPQPPCNSGNVACKVSNTGSCHYVIPPACPLLMPLLLHWQQIAGKGEQPHHLPPPPPPLQHRGGGSTPLYPPAAQRTIRCSRGSSAGGRGPWKILSLLYSSSAGIHPCAGCSLRVILPPLHSVWHLHIRGCCSIDASLFPYLVPFCGTNEGTAATDSVTWVHFTPSAMGPPPPRVFDFLSKIQQSASSVSHSSSQMKHPPPFDPPNTNDCTGKRAKNAADDNNLHVDPPSKYNADKDYINITSAKETSGVANQSIHNAMQRGR
jgi:hypothetical protein